MLKVRLRRGVREGAVPVVPVLEGAGIPLACAAGAQAAGFRGAAGRVLECFVPERCLLVGVGEAPDAAAWERAGGSAIAAAGEVRHLGLDARGLAPRDIAAFAAGAALRAWRFDEYRTRDVPKHPRALHIQVDDPDAVAPAWARAEAAVRGALFARDLVAEPANHLLPSQFIERLRLLEEHGVRLDVLGAKRLRKIGAGALLAVGGGSADPPRLAVLRWRGSFAAPPVAFVGKGMCFDTGGISIKPAAGMEEMRADMAGAAACAGAMLALALRRSPAPAVAVLALAENATGASSYRPGDVLRTASGRTVEVIDTDAEGRLALADALHHARDKFAPQAMLDLATLTGSIVTALGHHRAGLFGNDAPLMAAVAAAGEEVGERLWPMPIGARHREDLGSDIADLKQCAPSGSGAWGGRLLPDACHAAAFLREFAGDTPWAHLDIAGVEARQEDDALGPKGASGFGARLLDRLVELRFESPDR